MHETIGLQHLTKDVITKSEDQEVAMKKLLTKLGLPGFKSRARRRAQDLAEQSWMKTQLLRMTQLNTGQGLIRMSGGR